MLFRSRRTRPFRLSGSWSCLRSALVRLRTPGGDFERTAQHVALHFGQAMGIDGQLDEDSDLLVGRRLHRDDAGSRGSAGHDYTTTLMIRLGTTMTLRAGLPAIAATTLGAANAAARATSSAASRASATVARSLPLTCTATVT